MLREARIPVASIAADRSNSKMGSADLDNKRNLPPAIGATGDLLYYKDTQLQIQARYFI